MAKDRKGKCDGKCGNSNRLNLKSLLSLAGTPVGVGTNECKNWRRTHKNNCGGCPYELGCAKYDAIVQIQEHAEAATQRLFEIKTMEEFQKFADEFGEKEE